MNYIHLAIIEDDEMVREGLEDYLGDNPRLKIGPVVTSVETFLEHLENSLEKPQIDLMLLDIGLPGMSGIQGIRPIRQKLPDTDIIMLTTYEESDKIFKALCAGACSYMTKRASLAEIEEAIMIVYKGGSYMSPAIARKVVKHFMPAAPKEDDLLTPRQKQIVQGIVDGLSYKMIADKLTITLDTVRDHIKRIYRLLEVNSKAEVIRKALDGEI